MGLRTNPSQRQRRLGHELRKLREASGLKAETAGSHVSLGGPHLRHIEGGRTAIPEIKLLTLLDLYGCTRQTYVDELLSLNRATGRGWWHGYRRYMADQAQDLAELESTSNSLEVFEPLHIPGLLQAPDYVRHKIDAGDADPETRRKFCDFRLERQTVLTGQEPLRFHAIIHEAALHMHFVDAHVMRQQIIHLIEVSELRHVTIQIIPFKSDVLPAVGNTFSLFSGSDQELSTVMLEHDAGSLFLYDHMRIKRYRRMFDRLTELALPQLAPTFERRYTTQRDSLGLLQHLLYLM